MTNVGDEVLVLNEGLSVDIDIMCLNWLIHAETREDSTAPTEEAVGPSRDLRRRHVARKVLQLLDPGRKLVDVFVQSVGLETTGGLGPEAFGVDCIPLHAGGRPKVIEDVRSVEPHLATRDGLNMTEDFESSQPPFTGPALSSSRAGWSLLPLSWANWGVPPPSGRADSNLPSSYPLKTTDWGLCPSCRATLIGCSRRTPKLVAVLDVSKRKLSKTACGAYCSR